MSDPVAEAPTLEQRMDDVRAVMDAAGSERAALMGISEGASMSILFAATYPDRVQALVSCGGMARSTADDDYPWASPKEALLEAGAELIGPHWGGSLDRVRRAERGGQHGELHRRHDQLVDVRNRRWLAEHLPNAKLVELPGDDHSVWYQAPDRTLGEVQELLTGTRAAPEPERMLATVVLNRPRRVDAARCRARRSAVAGGARAAPGTRSRGARPVGGREVKSTGDGFPATFDGPARVIRCAREILDSSDAEGVQARAGMHTGECEVMGDDIRVGCPVCRL